MGRGVEEKRCREQEGAGSAIRRTPRDASCASALKRE